MKAFENKKIHILGVAGTLMGAFASFLKKSGIQVTGSDQNIYPPMSDVLKKNGVQVFTPFSPSNLETAKPDLVIVGNVIRKINPEMLSVAEKNIKFLSLPSALEEMILPQKHPIVICGTHGKTTTTSMMSWMLESCGENPSFFIGGVVKNFSESFRVTNSKYMVLEGDEYDTAYFDKVPKFTHYLPKDVILTSIEYDHADIYPDMNALMKAFYTLAEITSKDGYFIVCDSYQTTLEVAQKTNAKVITYGFSENAQSRATNIELLPEMSVFNWSFNGLKKRIELQALGKHNVLNALACLTLAQLRGLSLNDCINSLKTFNGVKRRQEVYGESHGITLIDDFAHHPTAVRETISAVKAKYPNRRLVACFEPRSATSRRKVFQKPYSESFDLADLVFVSKPYEATNTQPSTDVFSTEELLDSLKDRKKNAFLLSLSENGIDAFSKQLHSGDVVLMMSNGSFDGLLPKTLEALKKKD